MPNNQGGHRGQMPIAPTPQQASNMIPSANQTAQAAMARRRLQDIAMRQMQAQRAQQQNPNARGMGRPTPQSVAQQGMERSGMAGAAGMVGAGAPQGPPPTQTPQSVAAQGLSATGIPGAVQQVAGPGTPPPSPSGGSLANALGYTQGSSLYNPRTPQTFTTVKGNIPIQRTDIGSAVPGMMIPGGNGTGGAPMQGIPGGIPPSLGAAGAEKAGETTQASPTDGRTFSPTSQIGQQPPAPARVDPAIILAAMRRQQQGRGGAR